MMFFKAYAPRTFAVAAALLGMVFLGGCDRVGTSLGLTGNVAQVSPAPISPERLRVTLPKVGARATLAPVARRQQETVWQTLDGVTLTFKSGLLTATRGLGEDLITSDVSNTVRMIRGQQNDGYYTSIRSHLDGEDQTFFTAYQCRKEQETTELLEIDGARLSLRRIEEVCVSPDRSLINIYWVRGAGEMIRSRQWVSESVGDMVTEKVMR